MPMLLLLGCPLLPPKADDTGDTDPPAEQPGPSGDAAAFDTCAPDDGTAVEFTIGPGAACGGDPDGDHVFIAIWHGGWGGLDVGAYPFAEEDWTGTATLTLDGVETPAPTGRIYVSASDDQVMEGTWSATTEDGVTWVGDFTATNCGGEPQCG